MVAFESELCEDCWRRVQTCTPEMHSASSPARLWIRVVSPVWKKETTVSCWVNRFTRMSALQYRLLVYHHFIFLNYFFRIWWTICEALYVVLQRGVMSTLQEGRTLVFFIWNRGSLCKLRSRETVAQLLEMSLLTWKLSAGWVCLSLRWFHRAALGQRAGRAQLFTPSLGLSSGATRTPQYKNQ